MSNVSFIRAAMSPNVDDLDFPLTLNEEVLARAEFLLAAWAILALDHKDVAREFRAFLEHPAARAGTPLISMWGKAEQNRWLSEARGRIFASFDVVRFRLLCMRLLLSRVTDPKMVARAMAIEGFHGNEHALYCALMADRAIKAKFLAYMEPLQRPNVAAELTLSADKLWQELSEDIARYKLIAAAKAKARYKLTFIIKHNNMSLEDMAQVLLQRGIAYYFRARPTLTRLHASNSAKSAMDGGCSNLIRYWTHPDRARLVETDTGWSATVMSLTDAPESIMAIADGESIYDAV